MNSKYKSKKNTSKKPIIFWSVVGVCLIVIITMLIIRLAKIQDVSSYGKVEMITGQELFNQDEEEYLVLFYNFNGEKAYEEFDKGVYRYLTFLRDTKGTQAFFGMDTDQESNRICFVTSQSAESIKNATQFPHAYNTGESGVLKVYEGNCPILLIMSGDKVSDYKSGENAILSYLKGIMEK